MTLRISTSDLDGDRFDRFRLIGWWDQAKLAKARVLVVGAGALGNEIVKNLALLGVGNALIADLDRVENSNLSRSVLFREADNGRYKAEVAAGAARGIYPGIRVQPFVGNIVYDMGLGVYRWADLVIGGLDNREARLAINRACGRLGKTWIDGAIEQIQGTARVFRPAAGACYECTMGATDWKLLQARRSCNLLNRQEMEAGKTPTTPTIASIIAGVQCQEAVKLLHGMESIIGKGFIFNGLSTDAYTVEYQRKVDCESHNPVSRIIPIEKSAADCTAGALLAQARREVGEDAVLELGRDILERLVCPACRVEEMMYVSLGKVSAAKGACPQCGARREVVTFYRIKGDEPFADRPLRDIGVPPFDIVWARGAKGEVGFELSGDAAEVLGELADEVVEL